MNSLDITAATVDPALLDLPWHLPLEDWPSENIAALPKGLSRHTVRFAHLNDHVVAIKETLPELAKREYDMLKNLIKLDVPCVEPFAIINNRQNTDGEPLLSVLITRHLKFSLPYRAMWSQGLRPDTAKRLVDALALLLVRLHIAGFFWGDVSLSNTLFRRDAGAFAAYLVDAETGHLYDSGLSNGQRENDLEIARVNIAGELMDLIASGHATAGVDAVATSERIVAKYRDLPIDWAPGLPHAELAARLQSADVFVQNSRPGALDRAFGATGGTGGQGMTLSLQLLIMMGLLTLLPGLLLMMTSFTRILVVLSILRQALGLPKSY